MTLIYDSTGRKRGFFLSYFFCVPKVFTQMVKTLELYKIQFRDSKECKKIQHKNTAFDSENII